MDAIRACGGAIAILLAFNTLGFAVEIESEYGAGSTVTVGLPVAAE